MTADPSLRPMLFVRVRLYRGGMAEYVSEVLHDERLALMEDLTALRTAGKTEDDPEVELTRTRILWLVNALRDIDSSLVSVLGPDSDPR